MCFAELLQMLRFEGLDITEAKIRAALRSGRLSRPPLDRSNRFVFDISHVEQLRKLFAKSSTAAKRQHTQPTRLKVASDQ